MVPLAGVVWTVLKARMPVAWARASMINTPGMTGRLGKWPIKKASLMETFLSPVSAFPGVQASTLSIRRKG